MMFVRGFGLIMAALVLALAAATATAGNRDTEQCGREFDQCQTRRNGDYSEDAAKRAPCVAKCSGLYAACDAGVAFDKAKPWLEEQAQKTKRFFEELLDKSDSAPQPDPQKKTKKNSI